jgi:hypothetical protein
MGFLDRPAKHLVSLRNEWLAAWPDALATWSRYVQLHEPAWCLTQRDERREQLSGSFAMIRLVDHSISHTKSGTTSTAQPI